MSTFPQLRSVAFTGFSHGSLVNICLRPGRSRSGLVLVCGFQHQPNAANFARYWATKLKQSVIVRKAPFGFAVSVPVARRSSRLPQMAGALISVNGGLKVLIRQLNLLGWGGEQLTTP